MKRHPIIWPNVISQATEGGLTVVVPHGPIGTGSTQHSRQESESTMTEISDVKNAAVRLRAIYHNQELSGATSVGHFEQPRDERCDLADAELETALIKAGMMTEDQAITEITSEHEARKVLVTFEDGQTLEIQV